MHTRASNISLLLLLLLLRSQAWPQSTPSNKVKGILGNGFLVNLWVKAHGIGDGDGDAVRMGGRHAAITHHPSAVH